STTGERPGVALAHPVEHVLLLLLEACDRDHHHLFTRLDAANHFRVVPVVQAQHGHARLDPRRGTDEHDAHARVAVADAGRTSATSTLAHCAARTTRSALTLGHARRAAWRACCTGA